MLSLLSICTLLLAATPHALAQLSDSFLKTYPNTLALGSAFNPATPAYGTNLPHHHRTPFALSPDGATAYLAYLDAAGTGVHVQALNPTTFVGKGAPVTVAGGQEASGLVAQDDGFALLTNMVYTGSDAPTDGKPVAIVVRYKADVEAWRTWVGGPPEATNSKTAGKNASPFLAGDLVYSAKAGLYGAYFAITGYGDPAGNGNGHYADSHQYVDDNGNLKFISNASSHWGCSHSMGIAFEAADEPPFASLCADDHTGIWLNTVSRYMSGPKVSNENATQFAVGEPMGGYSGSYSVLANFPGTSTYLFAWTSRGAVDLVANDWGTDSNGDPPAASYQRTANHNVAVALLSDKATLVGPPAISTVGAHDGDKQLNLVNTGAQVDHSNVRVEAFDSKTALLSWEQIDAPTCDKPSYGCHGAYSGTYWQLIDSSGKTVGAPIKRDDVFVSGDVTRMKDGRLCWPYVAGLTWDLSKPIGQGQLAANVTKMSFACMALGGSGSDTGNTAPTNSSASAAPLPQVSSTTMPVDALPSPPPVSSRTSTAPAFSSTTLTTSTMSAATTSVTPTRNGRPPRHSPPPHRPAPPKNAQAYAQGGDGEVDADQCERD